MKLFIYLLLLFALIALSYESKASDACGSDIFSYSCILSGEYSESFSDTLSRSVSNSSSSATVNNVTLPSAFFMMIAALASLTINRRK